MTERRAGTVWIVLVITVFAALFFAPELFGGRVASTATLDDWLPWSAHPTGVRDPKPSFNPDCLTSYYPRRAFLHDAWRDGELPFWNPYSFCGTPFLADPQAQALYPPSWLVLPLDPGYAMGVFLFLHLAVAGAGMALLLRRHAADLRVAVLGGCAFAVSGFFAKHFGLPSFLATAAWLPWVFLAVEEVVRRPGARSAAYLALAGAATFLAGQPQMAMMIAYGAATFGVVSWAVSGSGARHGVRVVVAAAAAGIVAVAIAAAQLLPTLELASRSARARLPWETVLSGALHPVETLRFLVPDFFGGPVTGDEWSGLFRRGDGFYGRHQLNSVFAGTPVFLLALVGMLHRRTWRRALPFTAVFVVASLTAFGAPVVKPLVALLPGLSVGRLDRAGSLVVFAQFVPAALGAAALAAGGAAARRILGTAMIVVAIAGAWFVTSVGLGIDGVLRGYPLPEDVSALRHTLSPVAPRTQIAALFAAGTGVVLLFPPRRLIVAVPFALAVWQLGMFAAPYRGDRAQVFQVTPEIGILREALEGPGGGGRFVRLGRASSGHAQPVSNILPPSTNVPHRLRDLQGYNALVDRRLGETLETATGEPLFSSGIWSGRRIVAPEREGSLEHPLLAALAVRRFVDRGPGRDAWVRSRANPSALPRIRLTPAGRGVTEAELHDRIAARDLDPAAEVLWLGDGSAGAAGDDLRAPEVLIDTRNRILVRTNAVREAVLVVADSWDTGWRATLDGRPVPIRRAWGVVRAVVVPPGVHRVEMTYRPARFLPGAALSILGLLLALGALAVARPRTPSGT